MFIAFCLLLLVVIIVVASNRRKPFTIRKHSQTFLDGFQIPTKEFYDSVKEGLAERQITKVKVAEESFVEHHLFSAKRLYLKVTMHEYVYYICAAPYGTGTFVSSWLCIKDVSIVNRIPILSRLAGLDRWNKTFYQMDTEGMFRLAVQSTVDDVVNNRTEAKGVRGMAELREIIKN